MYMYTYRRRPRARWPCCRAMSPGNRRPQSPGCRPTSPADRPPQTSDWQVRPWPPDNRMDDVRTASRMWNLKVAVKYIQYEDKVSHSSGKGVGGLGGLGG